jgi:hypothetical protein
MNFYTETVRLNINVDMTGNPRKLNYIWTNYLAGNFLELFTCKSV